MCHPSLPFKQTVHVSAATKDCLRRLLAQHTSWTCAQLRLIAHWGAYLHTELQVQCFSRTTKRASLASGRSAPAHIRHSPSTVVSTRHASRASAVLGFSVKPCMQKRKHRAQSLCTCERTQRFKASCGSFAEVPLQPSSLLCTHLVQHLLTLPLTWLTR